MGKISLVPLTNDRYPEFAPFSTILRAFVDFPYNSSLEEKKPPDGLFFEAQREPYLTASKLRPNKEFMLPPFALIGKYEKLVFQCAIFAYLCNTEKYKITVLII